MRRAILRVFAAVLALATGPGARAATLPFTGSLRFQLANFASVTVEGAGIAAGNGAGGLGHLSQLEIPAGAFAATAAAVVVTDPAAFPIAGLQMTVANAAGSVSGTPLGGVLPLSGVAKVCLFGPCASANTNVSVPLSVMGSGGSLTATGTNGLPVNVSVIGSPWTTGVAKIPVPPGIPVESPSQMTGFAHGPASATSSTFQPGGVVQLVTPMSLRTSFSTEATVSTFATMTLRFVPEPGTLLLLGAGVAGLVAVSRTRRG